MGTDIHFHVERRGPTGWRRVEALDVRADSMVRCLRCPNLCTTDGRDWLHESNSAKWCPPREAELGLPERVAWYRERSETVFGLLGNGFLSDRRLSFFDDATPDVAPVAAPRGLPSDVGDEVRALAGDWDPDGHHHSHLTAGELLGYDWNLVPARSTWTEPLWCHVPGSFIAAMLRMARLAGGDLDSVRCVYWFDN